MKNIFLCDQPDAIVHAYSQQLRSALSPQQPLRVYTKQEVLQTPESFRDCEAVFSTWGMPVFTEDEIRACFPRLQAVFYAAGSVQAFAQPFFHCGIRVFSAQRANAIPVAEYTYAQILLSLKGVQRSAMLSKTDRRAALQAVFDRPGVYRARVGLIGLGAIGKMVCEKLQANDVQVFAYDAFLSEEEISACGAKKAALEELFARCDVISNHLANKPELRGVLNEALFSKMRPFATFINTGRGAQVDNAALAAALRKEPGRTAILDVTEPEILKPDDPLFLCDNAIITPHIAGSLSREILRMGEYMYHSYSDWQRGRQSMHEVLPQQLATLA